MPGYSPTDNNIIDPANFTTTPLVALDTFTGSFVDVTAYSSITLKIRSDVSSVFAGAQIDWSTDGITANLAPQRFTFDPASIGIDTITIHATVRAKYYRISYQNNVTDQSYFILFTLLRKGTPTGTVRSIDPINTSTSNVDVVEVQAILSGIGRYNPQSILLPLMDDVNFLITNNESYLFVSPRPSKIDNIFRKTVVASLTPELLTGFFTIERNTFFSITNNVERGNLYIRYNNSVGLAPTGDYDLIIPPSHTYQDPGQFGSVYPGDIYGVWDEVYIEDSGFPGDARIVSNFYG